MMFNQTEVGSGLASLENIPPTQEQSGAAAAGRIWEDNWSVMAYRRMQEASANRLGTRLDADAVGSLAKEYGPSVTPLEPGQYTEPAARILYQRQQDKQTAAVIDQQTPYGIGTIPRALTNAAVMLADPVNTAAMYMPIGRLGTLLAARAADAAGTAGRVAWRTAEGAAQGAAGMGALEAISIPLRDQLHDDYSSTDSLLNVLSGAVLGGAVHGIGGLLERPRAPVPPEIDAAAKQTALAQVLQDQPVAVDHLTQPLEANRALQVESAGSVLQYAPEATGEAGGERIGVEPGIQGQEVAGARQAEAAGQVTPDLFPEQLDRARTAITANRERSILDGDGLPPRVEPKAAAPAEPSANPELTARTADAQARMTEATQQAEAARAELQRRLAGPEGAPEPKPAPELVAADTQVARAEAEAKAYESIANCQRIA